MHGSSASAVDERTALISPLLGGPTPMERAALGAVVRGLGWTRLGYHLWDTDEGDVADAIASVRFANRAALWRFLTRPAPGFIDGYAGGEVEVDGDLVEAVAQMLRGLRAATEVPSWARRPQRRRSSARRRAGAWSELDAAFYRRWLDESMAHTCAYYERPDVSLEQAQRAKFDRVCRKLDLRPGEHVVEAGCDWGAFALHAAASYGVTVRAYDPSPARIAHARAQARRLGVEDRVELVVADFREIEGTCDAFVSLGMLERVGPRHHGDLRDVIARTLGPGGRGMLDFVGRARDDPMASWLLHEVRPGTFLPSLGEVLAMLEPADLAVVDVENLRRHYARTLAHWLERFELAAGDVALRFDETFVRRWRLFLAGAAAAFQVGTCQLYQVVFARADDDRLPWTRAHVDGGA